MKKKIVIISTHPIQYNAPLFKLMSSSSLLDLKVFYTWGQASGKVYDPGFGKEREWDIPLLNGYNYEFLENAAKDPGSHHFNGIDNPSALEKIDAYHPDIILIFGWSYKSHLKILRYYSGKKVVVLRGDSTVLDETDQTVLKKTIRRFFLKWIYHYVDYVMYAGSANRQYFLKHGLKEYQLIFVPHAIENERFYDADGHYESEAQTWRRALGINDEELVFLFAGKLEPKKDPELLLNAFMNLKTPDTRLILVGNGVLESSLKERARKDNRILFLPFQNQSLMPVVYRLGNIFVLPSKGPGETWGLAVNEAMACGRGVIISDKCGCAEDLVKDQQNGVLFHHGSEAELTEALHYFALNREKANVFGQASAHIIEKWNYTAQLKGVESLTTKLI